MPKDAEESVESELVDKASEIFQDAAHSEELLDHYFRGFITKNDLMDRLEWLRFRSGAEAEQRVLHPEPEGMYGDSGVA